MSQIDRTVLEIVARAAPLSESAIGLQMPGVHNEIVSGCLRRLREKQQIERSDMGLWSMKGPITTEPKEPAMAAETTKNKCAKCGSTDFTDGGRCRLCQKAKNEKYSAKRLAKPVPPPSVAAKKKAKRAKAVPLQMHSDRMVLMQFAIHIEDSAGVTHDLFLTGDVVKRLAIELQEYA